MRFLLKSAFMIFVLLLVIPFFAPLLIDKPVKSAPNPMPSGQDIGNAVSAARGTIEYMSGICEDRPEVCENSAGVLSFLGNRARQGAEIVYLYLGEKFGDDDKIQEEQPRQQPVEPGLVGPTADITTETRTTSDLLVTGAISDENLPDAPVASVPPIPEQYRIDAASLPRNVPVPTPRPR